MCTLQSVESRSIRFLAELCSILSPEGGERNLLKPLERELGRLGANVHLQDVPGGRVNVLASWGNPRVLLSTHLDTVPVFPHVAFDDTFVRSRGACDAKGQIVAQLAAIELLLSEGKTDFAWLGVSGEETDSAGAVESLKLAERIPACRAIVVGEPTDCLLAAGQKGMVSMRLSCKGKAAHGGMPELGVNAIQALSRWIVAIGDPVRESGHPLGSEVCNVGRISGGRAANVVADEASADVTLRTVPGGAMRDAVYAAKPACGTVEVLVDDPWDTFTLVDGFKSGSVPFGSDLPLMRALARGGAAVLAGPGSPSDAHTDSETLTIAQLRDGIVLFKTLTERLSGGFSS